jgi:hypothetical protein
MSILFWSSTVSAAHSLEPPILPLNVAFRWVPQYLEQSVTDDPRYTRIEALLDTDGCHVILLDKTTGREAFYSISKHRVDALAANGGDAYVTPIDCETYSPIDASPAFLIHFQDRFGNDISWKFVTGQLVPHASPEVIYRTSNSGIIFLYVPRRAPSLDGTKVTIAGREYEPKSTQPGNPAAAFYATDMTLGQIMPGTDVWTVEDTAADTIQVAKWNLVGNGGRLRTLAVKEISATETSIEQVDVGDPDAPHVILNVVRVNDGYELRSLSFESHFNTLWIFFGPELPLPERQTDDKRVVTFTVAENEQANIASGKLEIRRAFDAEHVVWHFDSPSFARGIMLETGVNLIPGDSAAQANCANDGCSDRLR